MREFIRWALVPLMRAWAAAAGAGLGHVPRPTDAPHAHSPGANSDRILIFGSGPAVGWGVLSHDLALPGSLARALSARTRRGADVDAVFSTQTTARSGVHEISALRLRRYDAIVVTLGGNDALTLTSVRAWRRNLGELLRVLEETSARSTRIFMLGIQPVRSVPVFDSPLGSVAERHATVLNQATADLCETLPRTTFVPLTVPAPTSPDRFRTAADYRHWAGLIADAMVRPVTADDARGGSDTAHVPGRNGRLEERRQLAVASLGILDTEPEDRFDRIAALARRSFNTRWAAFTISDGGRQWQKAEHGGIPNEGPRAGSFFTAAIEGRGPLVVLDALTDERFRDNPNVVGEPYIRFYAGFPIETESGERIGALCVFDSEPRNAGDVDVVLLRELALLLQAELHRRPERATTVGPA